MAIEDHENKFGYDYGEKTDLDVARHINLALLLCGGISEQDAGFDSIVGLNDAGIDAVARIISKVRAASSANGQQTKSPAGLSDDGVS